MTNAEKVKMWTDYVKASPEGYIPNALAAVLKAEGKEVLSSVLKQLGYSLSVDLIEAHLKHK